MANNIKCVLITKISDNSFLHFKVFGKNSEVSLNSESKLIISRIQNREKQPEERDKISTSSGLWSYITDKNQITYIVLTKDDYPERHIFEMINQIKIELQQLPNYYNQSNEILAKKMKMFLPGLVSKYEDLQSLDKIYQAQANVESVQLMMEDNMKKMLKNNTDIESLDKNTYDMRQKAVQFQKDSTNLARMMYWRNMKLKIIIILIIIALLLYIIVPIIVSKSQ